MKKPFNTYIAEIDGAINQMASRLTKSSSLEFEDSKQEMLIAVWRAYKRFDSKKASFFTFAYTSMRNKSTSIVTRERERSTALSNVKNARGMGEDILFLKDPANFEEELVEKLSKEEKDKILDNIQDAFFQLMKIAPLSYARIAYYIVQGMRGKVFE